ncbi:PREDICTED: uncharacterized protein LOC106749348, partial [Dinoponera quadriceps]|uniref:Uncharacterized protein LOC106749348 n=1 Tax=Dinoponera quadriceps TaxID=609295 RepID=A0A6P3Y094_DINQU
MTNSKLVLRNKFINHYDNSLQLNRWFLKPIGAWPEINESSVVENVFVPVQILICWTMAIFIGGPCLLYILFEAENIPAILNAIGPLFHRAMGSVNYLTLLKRRRDLRDCIKHMETDWQLIQRIDNCEIMIQYAKFGRLISGICGVIMQGSTMLFSIARAMKTVTIVIDNQTMTMYPMTCPSYQKFIDTRFSPTNEIVLSVQFLSTFVMSASTAGICSLAAVFATHACGQLNILYKRLDELDKNDEKVNNSAEQKMAVIVEHHLRILSLISRMESI